MELIQGLELDRGPQVQAAWSRSNGRLFNGPSMVMARKCKWLLAKFSGRSVRIRMTPFRVVIFHRLCLQKVSPQWKRRIEWPQIQQNAPLPRRGWDFVRRRRAKSDRANELNCAGLRQCNSQARILSRVRPPGSLIEFQICPNGIRNAREAIHFESRHLACWRVRDKERLAQGLSLQLLTRRTISREPPLVHRS